jgi:hypothetical protein
VVGRTGLGLFPLIRFGIVGLLQLLVLLEEKCLVNSAIQKLVQES